MNTFAVYCRQLLEAEDTNLYHFCTVHNLERTGIRRMLSGERMPKEELFQEFKKALTLTPLESEKLLELYEEQKIGERRYQNRIFIRNMLGYIGELEEFRHREPEPVQDIGKISGDPVTAVSNHMELIFVIQQMMRTEGKTLYSNIPMECPDFFRILQQEFYMKKKDSEFYHLLAVLKKADMAFDVNYNLKLMKEVLPFAIQSGIKYQPMYCYKNSAGGDRSISMYPYYLLSSTHVLLLSQDFRSGILYTDPVVLKCYHRENKKLMAQTQPFFFKTKDSERAIEYYIRDCVAASQPLFIMEYYPCILRGYSKELFLPYLRQTEEDSMQLIGTAEQSAKFLSGLKPYEAFLSIEGLQRFASSGEMPGQYANILKTFSKETRREVLRRIEQLCVEGLYHLHILPENFLSPFPKVGLEIYENRRITLISSDINTAYSSLDEHTLFEALEDYFESLLEKPEISSVGGTVKILRELQATLK